MFAKYDENYLYSHYVYRDFLWILILLMSQLVGVPLYIFKCE